MQHENGEIQVPIDSEKGIPLSPSVWASFLTGQIIHKSFDIDVPGGNSLLTFFKFIRRFVPFSFGLGWKIGARKFGKLKEPTFLDVTNSKSVNAPYYGIDNACWAFGQQWVVGKLTLNEYLQKASVVYEFRKKQILDAAINGFDIVFAYMEFPDNFTHYLHSKPIRLRRHYENLNRFVGRVKRKVGEATFIIVSDHGFSLKAETHSLTGFYSSNVCLNPKPRRITDFYDLILKGELLRMHAGRS